jgi:hypothetical protein
MFKTILEIQLANKKLGQTWFDKKETEFFNTHIESGVIAGRYFITSDQAPLIPRKYTIRRANSNGSIDTIGDFCEYSTKQAALNALEKHLKDEVTSHE